MFFSGHIHEIVRRFEIRQHRWFTASGYKTSSYTEGKDLSLGDSYNHLIIILS